MQWILTLCITVIVIVMCLASRVWTQYAVPMPMYAMPPAALPVLVPAVALHQPRTATTTTTTTTTTPRSVALAVPVPVQMGMPFAMGALPAYASPGVCQAKLRPPNCPPCPPCLCLPSCTPAFFSYCSPCHQKCRCRSGDDAPLPLPAPALPMPLPAPPPVVVVPFPPSIRLPKKSRLKHKFRFASSDISSDTSTDVSGESSTDDSPEASDLDYLFKRARKRKKSHRKRISARRSNRRSSDSEIVKPVLSYVSKDGDVKFKTRISNVDAARLLDEKMGSKNREQIETVKVFPEGGSQLTKNSRQIVLKSGPVKRPLQKSKKQIVFRSPANKKITNLSVSFQVTE